ncbi:MAG TPA: hypothetical protein VLB44_11950, partial [Kofleriaceae bacterium]|nr:hypothetical protein [Kofleriaceae bacterium]
MGSDGPRRSARSATGSADEARAYLQGRLVLESKVLFLAFGVLLLFYGVLYRHYPEIEPRAMGAIFAGS